MTAKSLIEVSSVAKSFISARGASMPLTDVNLEVDKREVVAILGRSGCGKTTLLRIIAGFETQTAGTIAMQQNLRLSMVFQDPRLLPWKTVRQNIELSLLHETGIDRTEAVNDVLQLVRLEHAADMYPDELSGGMAQRVGLARALAARPDVLLLDEPFGALDALTRRLMQRELARILQIHPMTAILVTHDVSEAVMLADRIVELKNGTIAHSWSIDVQRPRTFGETALAHLEDEILNVLLDNCIT